MRRRWRKPQPRQKPEKTNGASLTCEAPFYFQGPHDGGPSSRQARSKRSASITLVQAAAKSFTNFASLSSQA